MQLDSLQFVEAAGRSETLALALMSVAKSAGIGIDYDDLCAALGLSCTVVSVSTEPSPESWMTYGRDAFVAPAARLFGVLVRDLQPPDVAVEMAEAEEFEQHWEYSYKPLIQRALEHGQPVLAWQGWDGSTIPEWGIITAWQNNGFLGFTSNSPRTLRRLIHPAFQCYVVERIDENARPPLSDDLELFSHAFRHLSEYVSGTALSPAQNGLEKSKVITGPAAFDAWIAWIEGVAIDEEPWLSHHRHADSIAKGHQSAARFLKRRLGQVVERLPQIESLVKRCEGVAHLVITSSELKELEKGFREPESRGELLKKIRQAAHENLLLAKDICQLTTMLLGR